MKTTLLVKLEPENQAFIQAQKDFTDPSALINKLFHEEIQRRGIKIDPALKESMAKDKVGQQLELMADEATPAAG